MIEDLQDDYKNISGPRPGETNRAGMLLVVFIIWVIYAATILIISYPKIVSSLKKTNAIEVIKNRKELINYTETTQVTLYYVNYNEQSQPTFMAYRTRVNQTGVSEYHDALEGLLSGPTETALSYGSITSIPQGTKLIGVTVSGKTAFVDLTSDFIISYQSAADKDYIETSRQQLLKTLSAINNEITDVVILVESKEI